MHIKFELFLTVFNIFTDNIVFLEILFESLKLNIKGKKKQKGVCS